ncbi:MAG: Maltose/maltodextrin transport ATP-binding protein MalK, partial [uncultured Truepera sp.]
AHHGDRNGPDHAARRLQELRRGPGRRRGLDRGQGRRVRGAGRAVRLRQDDDAQPRRRADRADRRRHLGRRQAGQRPRPQGPRPRDGLPELRPLPEQVRLRQPRLPAEDAEAGQGRHRGAGPQDRQDPQHRDAAGPTPKAAVRWPAAARRAWAGPGPQPGRVPHGRAAVQPRRQAARPDAGRAQAVPPGAERDHPLRHARPGRGGHHGRQDGGDEWWGDAAVRLAEGDLRR